MTDTYEIAQCEDPSCGKQFDKKTATKITVFGDIDMTVCPECKQWWKEHDEFHDQIVTHVRRGMLGEVKDERTD